jgi:quinol monooxygenase YgiN
MIYVVATVPTGIPAQAAPRDDAVTVVERWESVDALQAHLMAPHMLSYRAKVKGMVLGTTLQVLEPV